MGKDINFTNILDSPEGFEISMGQNPLAATGNKLLANIFEVTFMTNISQSLLSNGYGGDGVETISMAFNPNDIESMSALIKIAVDNTVSVMKNDQDQYGTKIPATERIVSAEIIKVEKVSDRVYATIKITPEEYENISSDNLLVVFPL